jgi:TfoX/Sxy family transcriptional regulator of competence genes
MAYSETLANRVREALQELPVLEEKAMMGGLAFMVNDKMCVGIIRDELMCRIDPELHAAAVEENGCRTMDFTKRPMKGYVMVDETGLRTRQELAYWVNLCLDFNDRAKSSKRKK